MEYSGWDIPKTLSTIEANEYDSLHSECVSTWQSPLYEIVSDSSDKSGTIHWIILSGVSGRDCGRRVASGGKDLSLVACTERAVSKRQNLEALE